MMETAVEYWRWEESHFIDREVNLNAAESITCGIDIGSVSTQAVILANDQLYAYASLRTGCNSLDSAQRGLDAALAGTPLDPHDIHFVVGTGYGRVNVPFAQRTLTEIGCHARGANYMGGPSIRTILDMGGQDSKVIHVDERGRAVQFLMNDKCAAGTGRGMEVIADLLAVPITELGAMSLDIDRQPPPVSSVCVVFAKSEAMGLMRDGMTKKEVLAAYCGAMAHRTCSLIKRIGLQKEFTITGGISKNIGVVSRILDELSVEMIPLTPDPQIAGALGAALFAKDLLGKSRSGDSRPAAITGTVR